MEKGSQSEKKAIKAVVFIDGNNFYHNLTKMSRVKHMGIKPGHIDFLKLSEAVCSHFGVTRERTRYYNSVPSLEDGKEIYWKHMNFLEELQKLPNFDIIKRKLQRSSTEEALSEKKVIISSLGLCSRCRPLVDANCYECIGNIKKREKGIDVHIAIDMVEFALKGMCDCVILISGDSDFIPALSLVKENGKGVYSAFMTFGYSYDLRKSLRFFIMDQSFIKEKCLKEGVI